MVPQWMTRVVLLALLIASSMTLTGCEAIANIFQAGVWVGALLVVFVVAAVIFIAAKIRG